MTWDLEELREKIRQESGEEQLNIANPHICSIGWKSTIADFHFCSAAQAFDEVLPDRENSAIQAADLSLGTGENSNRFFEANLAAEANLIACAQSVHSMADILAYVIFYSVNTREMVHNDDLKLQSVQASLEPSPLKSELVKLLGLPEFKYLSDFVNKTKHISLVFSDYNIDLRNPKKHEHGLQFEAFSYSPRNGNSPRTHPEKWHGKFMDELKRISGQYVNIGKEIVTYIEEKT